MYTKSKFFSTTVHFSSSIGIDSPKIFIALVQLLRNSEFHVATTNVGILLQCSLIKRNLSLLPFETTNLSFHYCSMTASSLPEP